MKGHEATLAVVEHSFVLDTRDRAALVRRLERASRLAVSVPIFALRRARSYADLENARAAIVAAAWPGAR